MADDGGGKVDVVAEETDMGDATQCSQHPLKKNPGGICGFCLQEKLGKLVSSPFATMPILGRSSSSSPSPSFRSDIASIYGGGFKPKSAATSSAVGNAESHARRSRMRLLLSRKKRNTASDFAAFCRSKSTTSAPRRMLTDADKVVDESPRRRKGNLWTFLHLSSSSSKPDAGKAPSGAKVTSSANPSSRNAEEDDGLRQNERKVSRSRSVGCGSRSFSGDFFGRISTGFGDCTLLRAESQREAKPIKSYSQGRQSNRRCGGIFGGFMLTSSSSSSSSSSRWVSDDIAAAGNKQIVGTGRSSQQKSSWAWALASPMRAFSRPSSKKSETAPDKNVSVANLGAIPSLLAVRPHHT